MEYMTIILTSSVVGGIISSLFTFVTFLINRKDTLKKESEDKADKSFDNVENRLEAVSNICLGLAYDRIIHVGESYLKRGNITVDEREDFRKYLWQPYHNAGGNGSGDAMMASIDKLPIVSRKER